MRHDVHSVRRRGPMVLMAAMLAVVGSTVFGGANVAHAAAGTISGTVTSASGASLTGVQVEVCPTPLSTGPCTFTTTSAGAYSVSVAPGDYMVGFSSEQYAFEFWDDIPMWPGTIIEVTDGAEITGIDAELDPLVNVFGNVLGNTNGVLPPGDPLEGVRVSMCPTDASQCATTTTDDAGDWSMWIPPGVYTTQFDDLSWQSGTDGGFDVEYWNDEPRRADALEVAREAGTAYQLPNAVLLRRGAIAGTVTGTDDIGIEGVTVRACPATGETCSVGYTEADGTYLIGNAATGENTVQFSDFGSEVLQQFYDGGSVVVTSGAETAGIDQVLRRSGSISGRIVDTNGDPVPGHNVIGSSPGSYSTAITDGDGFYLLDRVDPRYGVQVVFYGGAYFTEYYDDVENGGEATLVEVVDGTTTAGIDATIVLGASISGTVTTAVAGAVRVNAIGDGMTANAFADASGAYEFLGLPPGDYTLRFSDDNDVLATEYYDDAPDRSTATVVTAVSGANTGYDAHLDAAVSLSGTVLEGGQPSPGAFVLACLDTSECPYNAVAGDDGAYQIDGMKPGPYFVRFESRDPAWATEFSPGALRFTDAVAISVTSDLTAVDADLRPGGSISGFVSDATGRGLFASEGLVTACSDVVGWCTSIKTGYFGFAPGEYTIGRLPAADDYIVRFEGLWEPIPRETEWWCDTTVESDAISVRVTAGQDTAGIDASLRDLSAADHDTCDVDDDGVPDPLDNCAAIPNPNQENADSDDLGDACDPDDDDDGDLDTVDNCPITPNPDQADLDGDGIGDACDPVNDRDGDDIADAADNCPATPNPDQADLDADGSGDACDTSDDRVVFSSLAPERFADSRDEPTFDGRFRNTGRRPAGTEWEIDVAGRGQVPADAEAVVLNLTVLNAAAPGFATVHPCSDEVPNASSANYVPGSVEPNEIIAKLSPTGTICVFTLTDVDLIVDVVGAVVDSPLVAIEPTRYADSRDEPTFDGRFRDTGTRRSGTTWEIAIAGRGVVPGDATAAVVNLTVTGGQGPGFATVHPCGELPIASSLNYDVGITRPNELVARLSPNGTLCVFVLTGVEVIVDVTGYLDDVPGYRPIAPSRYADSRSEPTFDSTFRDTGARRGNTVWAIDVGGRGDVPADATVVVANVTVTGAAAPGFATVFDCSQRPGTSSLNYGAGVTRPNEVVTRLSPAGQLCVYTLTDVDVIVDIVGHD